MSSDEAPLLSNGEGARYGGDAASSRPPASDEGLQIAPRAAKSAGKTSLATVYVMIFAVTIGVGTSGLQAILAMYFNDRLYFSDSTATFWVAVYIACYNVFGVVGGVAADGYWGKYAVQVYTTVIWTAGVLLVLPTALSGVSLSHGLQLALAFGGLGLASVGIGAQQPVQSAFVGDQITRENREHVAWYFTWYYFFGNVGNVIGESVCPTLRADVSYFSVFLLLAICTSLSLALFLLGSPHYTKLPPDPAKRVTECTLSPETKEVVWRMARIFAPLPIFWGLYFQQSSTWVFQSQAMNRNLFSWSIPPDIIPTFNDILVCVLIPLLDRLVYPALRRCGLPLLPLSRIAAGILCTALAFVCSGLLQLYIDRAPADSVWVLWQIPQYVFITFAEVLVIITGLEFAYSQAPVHLRSVVSSMTYISSALGQALVAVVEKVSVGSQAGDFFLFAALMFLFLLLFLALVRGYEYRVFETTDERMEDEAAAPVTDVAAAPPSE